MSTIYDMGSALISRTGTTVTYRIPDKGMGNPWIAICEPAGIEDGVYCPAQAVSIMSEEDLRRLKEVIDKVLAE
jgi:hypothetical protein